MAKKGPQTMARKDRKENVEKSYGYHKMRYRTTTKKEHSPMGRKKKKKKSFQHLITLEKNRNILSQRETIGAPSNTGHINVRIACSAGRA